MKYLIALACLATTGCWSECRYDYSTDKVKEERIFFECMKALPAGPQSTKYNDWDEVVAECRNTASQFSNTSKEVCE